MFTDIFLLWIKIVKESELQNCEPPSQPKKHLWTFFDGITFQPFELEGCDLVQCSLLTNKRPNPLKNSNPQNLLLDFSQWDTMPMLISRGLAFIVNFGGNQIP